MAIQFTDTQHYSDIADAIRGKNGTQDTYKPSEMAAAIDDLPSGGLDENLAALMAGTATGDITISGITDLSTMRISVGRSSGHNRITGLHMPDLEYWCLSNNNYATRSGGIVDLTQTSTKANTALLQTLDLPNCKRLCINGSANASYPIFCALTTLNTPKLEYINGTLRGCGLIAIDWPEVTYIPGSGFFRDMTGLTEIRMPKLTVSFTSYTFQNCSALRLADLGYCYSIYGAFMGTATSLEALVLRASGNPCALSTSTDLTNSPIANGTGYVYVPRALISTYEAASNWSAYAGQFRALEDYTDDGTITGRFIMPT